MGEYAILTDIGLKVIIYIEYILLASGLYLQMCGVEFFNKHFTAEKRKRRIYHYLIETGIRIVVIGLRCPVIVYLALIYGMVIISLRILHVYTYQHAIRGMTAIILMEMMELAYTLFGGNERLGFVGHNIRIEYNLQTLVMILLLMMVQVTVTIAGEAWRLRTRKNKYFYLVIGMKRIMEALLCYRMMELTDFANSNLPYVLMLICSILLDYVLIYDIEMYKVFRREEIRRIQTPLNREQYYVKMEEEHLKIRRMFHDMKNQLMILEGNPAFQTEQAQNVITGFRKEMDSLGGFYHTGNADLDLILFDCRSRALEKNIAFDAIIQEGCLSFMKQEDINAIFVNAIVNAIDACAAIEDGERSIHIQAGSRLNDVMISIKNTVGSRDAARKLQTSKKDKKLHGLGIPSIQRAAEKYQGFVSIAEDEKYFQLVILFVKEEQ